MDFSCGTLDTYHFKEVRPIEKIIKLLDKQTKETWLWSTGGFKYVV